MRNKLYPLLALLLVTAPGCAFLRSLLGAFKKPTFNFKTANLANASLEGAGVNLVYTLDNPNPIGISLAEISYLFQVEGKQVVAGQPPNGLQVGASKKSDLTFPANIKFRDIVPVVETFLTKDQAAYQASGHIGVKTPIGLLKFPLSKSGSFEVPKLPQVAFGTPKINNLSLTGATIQVPLKLTNRNTYSLPINNVSGGLSIAGAQVSTVTTGNLGDMAGKATRELNLPININFASALQAANALRSGRGTLALTGAIQSAGISVPFSYSQNVNFTR